MKTLKNILSLQKIKTWLMLLVAGVAIISVIGFTTAKQEFRTVRNVKIHIDQNYKHEFIDEQDVLNLITISGRDEVVDKEARMVNLKELEKRIKKNTFAYKVHVHKDLEGDLHVNVEQCHPIARVIMSQGDFYISDKGTVLPMSQKFTARVPVVSGHMTGRLLRQDFADDSVTAPFFKFFKMIEEDRFLQAMIAEIDLRPNGDVVIYPQIGKQYFLLGTLDDIEDKILKMKIFYKNILPMKGWNFCEKVNLKFKDQIITE